MNTMSYPDIISLINFLSKKDICIPVTFEENKTNCNKRVVELFDKNSKTKYKVTCIPLETLKELHKKYIPETLPKESSFDNLIEYKKHIFDTLNKKQLFNNKNIRYDVVTMIKYYFKIVLNKKRVYWDEKCNPLFDSFDKFIGGENYMKYLNFIKSYDGTQPKYHTVIYAISDHEIVNILANMLKYTNCAYSTIFRPANNYFEMELSPIVVKYVHMMKTKKLYECYIPVLFKKHWTIIYLNVLEKYIIYYNSYGNPIVPKLAPCSLVYKNGIGFVNANDEMHFYNPIYEIIKDLASILGIRYVFTNEFLNQYLDHTCGFFVLAFVYLNESYDKKLVNVKKMFNTLYCINDNIANLILNELVVNRLDLSVFDVSGDIKN